MPVFVYLYIVAFQQHLTRGLLQSPSIEGVYSLSTLELNSSQINVKFWLQVKVHNNYVLDTFKCEIYPSYLSFSLIDGGY